MDIHPFDQPDVEAAKVLARDMVKRIRQGAARRRANDLRWTALPLMAQATPLHL